MSSESSIFRSRSDHENLSDHSQDDVESENELDEEAVNVSDEEESGETPLHCYLAGIELFNFKSYKGHHSVGPFTNVTAIIGSNGSGKSNLMDAISFALCMRSDKLRAKRVDHLISRHSTGGDDDNDGNNGDTFPPEDPRIKAYVKLIFRSRDKRLPERTVERRILLNNNCEYAIDKQVCHSQDQYRRFITRLGLDAKSKIFLLFQGTVDALVTKNPNEFTKIIEELSGSAKYAKQYNTMNAKCADYEQQLHVLQSKKQSLQKSKVFLDSLRRQQNVNENITAEIEQIKVQMILLDLHKYSNEIAQAIDRLQEENATVKEIDEEIAALEQQKTIAKQAVDIIEREAQAIAREYRESDLNVACKEKHTHQQLKYQMKAAEKKLSNAMKNKDELEKKKKASLQIVEQLEEEIQKIDAQIKEITDRVNASRTDLQITRQQVEEFIRLKNQFQQRVSNIAGYQPARNIERNLSFLNQQLAVYETRENDIIAEKASLNSSIVTKQTIIEKLGQELLRLDDLKKKEAAKAKDANDKLGTMESQLQESERLMKDARESMKHKYEWMKRSKKRIEAQRLIEHLTKSYPGRVHGRFGTLCKPGNKRHFQLFSTVAGRYQGAIVVDSFSTVQDIIQQESREAYQMETFLALDMLNAPDHHTALREIRRDLGQPMFDLLRKPTNILNIDKAIRFVVGNTVVSRNRDAARTVAYELGQGKAFNAISEECGTYFKTSGEISANFGKKDLSGVYDEEDYLKEQSDYQKLENNYLEAQENVMKQKNEIEAINAEILRIETHQTIARQHIKELKASVAAMNEQLIQLDDEGLKGNIAKLNIEIAKSTDDLENFKEQMSTIERQVFGEFLTSFGNCRFNDVKHFESAYYDDHEADIKELHELQKNQVDLKHKLEDQKSNDIDKLIEMWKSVIDNEEQKLQKFGTEMLVVDAQLKRQELDYEELLEQGQKKKKEQEMAENKLKKVLSDLKSAFQRLGLANKSIENFTMSLRNARQKRHDLYRKAYVDSTTLPVDQEQFRELLSNRAVNEVVLEEEDDLIIDFTDIEELLEQIANPPDFYRTMFQLENQLKAKESELHSITIGDDVNLDQETREAREKIKTVNKDIEHIRAELKTAKVQFEQIKRDRQKKFTTFLNVVAENLDIYYKEMTQNQGAQAFLIPENSEEPYLSGVNYSCIAPGKTFQPMSRMSGGEKCLAAFAFIFSVYSGRLPSFFIMDEIDGPLDSDNIRKLVAFINSKSKGTQFIFISHKLELICQAFSLIGVTRDNAQKTDGYAKSETYSLDLRGFSDS